MGHTSRDGAEGKTLSGRGSRVGGMPELRGEEQWAARMVQAALGRPVQQHDDGSQPGMHDLDIVGPGGALAALEVTTAADSDSIQLWKLVNGRGERWIVPGLKGGWMVFLQPTARAKRVLTELPSLLGSLEVCNIRDIGRTRQGQHEGNPVVAHAKGLGIAHASQGGTSYPGSIYVSIELPSQRSGGIVSASGAVLSSWVTEFLTDSKQTDVRAKLSRSGSNERHAFIIVPGFSTAPFGVSEMLWREDESIPRTSPSLPVEVTHVWLVSTLAVGTGLRWAPSTGWHRIPKLVEAGTGNQTREP